MATSMPDGTTSATFASAFDAIGIIAGSGPEAGVDLWSKVLRAARAQLQDAYTGDSSAPSVRVISSPTLGLPIDHSTEAQVDRCLDGCLKEMSETCRVYTIACNALQARAQDLLRPDAQHAFVTFDKAVDSALSALATNSFFLIGSSTIMGLTRDSIYAPLQSKYEIRTPNNWVSVDTLIQDIKLTAGHHPTAAQRLQSLVAEARGLPAVLACTDFPLVSAEFGNWITIDASSALATLMVRLATRAPPCLDG